MKKHILIPALGLALLLAFGPVDAIGPGGGRGGGGGGGGRGGGGGTPNIQRGSRPAGGPRPSGGSRPSIGGNSPARPAQQPSRNLGQGGGDRSNGSRGGLGASQLPSKPS